MAQRTPMLRTQSQKTWAHLENDVAVAGRACAIASEITIHKTGEKSALRSSGSLSAIAYNT